MKDYLDKIEDNIYDRELYLKLLDLKAEHPSGISEAFFYLGSRDIKDFTLDSLRDESKTILDNFEYFDCALNKEIRGRWCDYLQLRNKQNVQNIRLASISYFNVFENTKKYKYLIRSLKLINKAKGLFTNELDDIYDKSQRFCKSCTSPYCQSQILKELYRISPEQTPIDFEEYLNNQIESFYQEHFFENARFVLESLKNIKILPSNDYKIKRAESFEIEGIHQISLKKPNTHYPGILLIFTKGLKELKGVNEAPKLKKD